MARKQLTKNLTQTSPLSPVSGFSNLAKAAIYVLDTNSNPVREISSTGDVLGQFLLNPASWEEGKTSNWVPNPIPGQSDPILQWLHGGARTVSFEALVTADTSDFDSQINSQKASAPANKSSFFANIAANFFKTSLPNTNQQTTNSQLDIQSYDISGKLNFYRSLLYPVYDDQNNPRKLMQSPPLIVLEVGTSISMDSHYNIVTPDQDVWVVTNLRIKITKQQPNLMPMEAVVSFELMQYTIKSFDRNRFLNG